MVSKRIKRGVFQIAYRHVTFNRGTWIDVVAIKLQEGVFLRFGRILGENFHLRGGEAGNSATARTVVRRAPNKGWTNSFPSYSHHSPVDVRRIPFGMTGCHTRVCKPLRRTNS
jgi:hypothetical protein